MRDLGQGKSEAFGVQCDGDGCGSVLVVVERLAHAHEHDVGDLAAFGRRSAIVPGPLAEVVAGHHDLAHDLGRGEIAHQALGAGMAELAGEGAADRKSTRLNSSNYCAFLSRLMAEKKKTNKS